MHKEGLLGEGGLAYVMESERVREREREGLSMLKVAASYSVYSCSHIYE
jgi:hypothetical protein